MNSSYFLFFCIVLSSMVSSTIASCRNTGAGSGGNRPCAGCCYQKDGVNEPCCNCYGKYYSTCPCCSSSGGRRSSDTMGKPAKDYSSLLTTESFESSTTATEVDIATTTQPSTTTALPSTTTTEPTTTTVATTSTANPTTITTQLITTTANPTTTTATPETTTASPVTTTAQHSTTTAQPSTTTSRPTTAKAEPSTTTVQPSTTTSRPSTTTAQPSTTTARPSTTTTEPVRTTAQPTTVTRTPTTTKAPTTTAQLMTTTTKPASVTTGLTTFAPTTLSPDNSTGCITEYLECFKERSSPYPNSARAFEESCTTGVCSKDQFNCDVTSKDCRFKIRWKCHSDCLRLLRQSKIPEEAVKPCISNFTTCFNACSNKDRCDKLCGTGNRNCISECLKSRASFFCQWN